MREAASVKARLRSLVPPFFWQAISRRYGRGARPHSFGGVFDSFAAVADEHPWVQRSYLQASRTLLQEVRRGETPPHSNTTRAVLALIVNRLGEGVPTILDWAGGTGLRYWSLRAALNRPVRWRVVDHPALAALSGDVMGHSDELTFETELPSPGSARIDIVLVYSALQYVERQSELLERLAAYQPTFIVLARLMAHRSDSYVTRQVVHGHATPCKVSNLQEIEDTVRRQGYRPVLAIEDGIDLSGLFDASVPREMRVGMEHLLLFERTSEA